MEQMEQQKPKRVRRGKDVIIQEKIQKLNAKILDYKQKIEEAEKEIQNLTNPQPTVKMKDIREKIDELNLPLDDVMKAIEKMGKK